MEAYHRKNFYRLLDYVESSSVRLSPHEWFLLTRCLDELHGRPADFSFLCLGSLCLLFQRRSRARLGHKFIPALYAGLVGYDFALQRSPFAASTLWSCITTLDTPLGACARTLHTPVSTCDPPTSALRSPMTQLMNALVLKSALNSVFQGSCSNIAQPSGSSLTRLCITTRFWQWNALQIVSNGAEKRMSIALCPSLRPSSSLRRSYPRKDVILPHIALLGRLWYRLHYAAMDGLGLSG